MRDGRGEGRRREVKGVDLMGVSVVCRGARSRKDRRDEVEVEVEVDPEGRSLGNDVSVVRR